MTPNEIKAVLLHIISPDELIREMLKAMTDKEQKEVMESIANCYDLDLDAIEESGL